MIHQAWLTAQGYEGDRLPMVAPEGFGGGGPRLAGEGGGGGNRKREGRGIPMEVFGGGCGGGEG